MSIILFLLLFLTQTQIDLSQSGKFVWSEGLHGQRLATNQIKIPHLTFTVDTSIHISGDRTCTITPKSLTEPGLIYIFWSAGKLSVFSGIFIDSIYKTTMDKLDISGDCVSVDLQNNFLVGINGMLWFGSYGQPQPNIPLTGTCVNFFPYSYGLLNGFSGVQGPYSSATPVITCNN